MQVCVFVLCQCFVLLLPAMQCDGTTTLFINQAFLLTCTLLVVVSCELGFFLLALDVVRCVIGCCVWWKQQCCRWTDWEIKSLF